MAKQEINHKGIKMATNNSYTKAEIRFKKYIDALRRELHNSYWHFIIYKYIEKCRVDYQNELQVAGEFWGLTQRAHLLDTIMRLNKICDNDPETINIHTLLDLAENNLDIFTGKPFYARKQNSYYPSNQNVPEITEELLLEHKQRYSDFSQTNLRKLRNRVLAHIDKGLVMTDFLPFEGYKVDIDQIETIINDLDNTLDLLSIAFDGSKYSREVPFLEQGMNVMMELMRKGLIERERLD
ncbi:hypothetical protein ACFLYN_02995 [Chloroflexota bacterium]